jgi:hypothetical protein
MLNKKGNVNMKMTTALDVIQKEADFLGQPFLETMMDIKLHGTRMYSERVVQAFNVVFAAGVQMFAEVK